MFKYGVIIFRHKLMINNQIKRAQNFTPATRISSDTYDGGRKFLLSSYFVYLSASIALCITTGYFLWASEVPNYS
jgi:hypothetical protein